MQSGAMLRYGRDATDEHSRCLLCENSQLACLFLIVWFFSDVWSQTDIILMFSFQQTHALKFLACSGEPVVW